MPPELAPLVSHLNAAQREAVTAPPGHRLVLAGAGSGKTRVLTHRVAWLIAAEHVSPLSILAVTFTNKAAAEMRSRIEQLVDVPIRAMWVGTFHGIAHRMLRLHWKEAELPQNFQILDADDQLRLVRRVLKGLDLPDDQWPPRMVAGWINTQKEETRRPQDFGTDLDFSQQQLVRIYAAYEESCRRQGVVDFAELLLRAFELTRDNADIQAHYHRRFRHLLVDEFQDTNALQYRWLKTLAGASGTLFAVGDDDQSVYSWRGARVENMLHLSRDYLGCEIVRLEQNYRSTGTILLRPMVSLPATAAGSARICGPRSAKANRSICTPPSMNTTRRSSSRIVRARISIRAVRIQTSPCCIAWARSPAYWKKP